MHKVRNINEIEIHKGVISGFYTNYNFYFKEGGTKYYIRSVGKAYGSGTERISDITIGNSKTGKSTIILISDLDSGKFKDSYFFTK